MNKKQLDKILSAGSGKRLTALAAGEVKARLNGRIPPSNETEQLLYDIWLQLFNYTMLSVDDDFFQIGGNSLAGVQLISMIHHHTRIEISLADVFNNPTILGLSELLQTRQVSLIPPLTGRNAFLAAAGLSFGQERLWIIDQLEGSRQYHIPTVLRLKEMVDPDAVADCLRKLVERHQILRTVIRYRNGEASQELLDGALWELRISDFAIEKCEPGWLDSYIQAAVAAPFDLSNDFMIRGELIMHGQNENILVVTVHHIAWDEWSMPIIGRELTELYQSYVEKRAPLLLPVDLQYIDYALWQRAYLSGDVLERKIAYWMQKLRGWRPLFLPPDFAGPIANEAGNGATVQWHFDVDLLEKMRQLARSKRVTLFTLLLSAFNVLLHRYTGQEDICVGSPLSGRHLKEVDAMIGFFVNTVVLRSFLNYDIRFTELLHQVHETVLQAHEYQDAPYERVVERLLKDGNVSGNTIFRTMLVLQQQEESKALEIFGDDITSGLSLCMSSRFDMTFVCRVYKSGLKIAVEFRKDLYKESTIVRMLGHYEELLRSVVQDPETRIGELRMLPVAEEKELLGLFQEPEVDYGGGRTLVELLGEQALRTPEATALLFGEEAMSYRELGERSNQLGHYLRRLGVREERLVGICVERSLEMIIGILGILKAGGAYVPIDPEYPLERIGYMLSDTGSELVLSSVACADRVGEQEGRRVILLDRDWEEIGREAVGKVETELRPSNLAYVIYTSGSTGKPKGVMIEHRSVVNLALGQASCLGLSAGTRTLQFASFGFDASCYEIFNTLLSGGVLVLPEREDILSADRFESFVNRMQVDLVTLPPSYQSIIKDNLGKIKTVVSAGEPLNKDTCLYIRSKGIRVINAYGPTECTVCATLTDEPIREEGIITIGEPTPNVRVYILDENRQVVPAGVVGELYLGGIQVGRGYLNKPELTEATFLSFAPDGESAQRLYRTGDLGRWLPRGVIEYFGRRDDQVKIRGYRIELGEIERTLLTIPDISNAMVVVKKNGDDDSDLHAYLVSDKTIVVSRTLSFLSGKLPAYMIPTAFYQMEKIPLMENGKVNRNSALLDVIAPLALQGGGVEPVNDTEEKLTLLWARVLHTDLKLISTEANFFDIGGNSLKLVDLVKNINRDFGSNIGYKDVFKYSSIRKMSDHILHPGASTPESNSDDELGLLKEINKFNSF